MDGGLVTEIIKLSNKSNFDETSKTSKCVSVIDDSKGKDITGEITRAFQEVTNTAINFNKFPEILDGKHSEMHRIAGGPKICFFERFMAPIFGLATLGVYMIVYDRNVDLSFRFWVQVRGPDGHYSNMLDATVAGSIKARQTSWKAIIDEASDEASFTQNQLEEHAEKILVLTHFRRILRIQRVIPCMMQGYDMLLPQSVIPKPAKNSTEVTEFKPMNTEEVLDAMQRGEFRPGSELLWINFFIRHKIIPPLIAYYNLKINKLGPNYLPPACSKISTILLRKEARACCNAVTPSTSVELISTWPVAISSFTTASCPFLAA